MLPYDEIQWQIHLNTAIYFATTFGWFTSEGKFRNMVLNYKYIHHSRTYITSIAIGVLRIFIHHGYVYPFNLNTLWIKFHPLLTLKLLIPRLTNREYINKHGTCIALPEYCSPVDGCVNSFTFSVNQYKMVKSDIIQKGIFQPMLMNWFSPETNNDSKIMLICVIVVKACRILKLPISKRK